MLRRGDPAGIRTPDTLLKRQVLCLLSYWVILKSMYLVPLVTSFKTCSFERKGATAGGGDFRLSTQAEIGTGRQVATWLGWQDSNLQYQSQSLVCYRYTTSHHRLAQRGRHCRPPASSGVGDGARTHDTRNHNPVLIPTELHPPFMEPCPGTPGGTRTPGLLLRRQLLYPTELLAHVA